jgi:hypothetical protein
MPYGREACAVGGLSSGLRRRVAGLQRYAAGLIVGHSNTEAGRQATWWTRKWHAADSTRGARVLCAGCVPTRKEYGNLARTQSICEVTQVTAGQHRGEQEPTRPMSRRVTLDQESPGSSPGGATRRLCITSKVRSLLVFSPTATVSAIVSRPAQTLRLRRGFQFRRRPRAGGASAHWPTSADRGARAHPLTSSHPQPVQPLGHARPARRVPPSVARVLRGGRANVRRQNERTCMQHSGM